MHWLRHADDLGVSKGVTDEILAACDEGAIDGVSLVPNGLAFDRAVEGLRARPAIRVSVHLNLVEGRPLSSPNEVPALVDGDGFFRHTFFSLWLSYFMSGPLGRECLAAQVRLELWRQLARVSRALGTTSLRVDSHQHYHLLPFVLDELLRIAPTAGVKYVRTAREPWFWPKGLAWSALMSGVLRRAVLGVLSARGSKRILACGIETNRWLYGVAASGRMDETAVKAALRALGRNDGDGVSEILFHPGGAHEGEEGLWSHKYARFLGHYFSPWRDMEKQAALKMGQPISQEEA